MSIKGFRFDDTLTREFHRLRRDLYAKDPRWIPPIRRSFLSQFAPDYWFYRRRTTDHRRFACLGGGRVIGHVSAFVDGELRDSDGTSVGQLGFFDCVEEEAVAEDLLGAAVEWLQTEHGIRRVWGPIDFDIWHGYRFMTRGFSERVFYGEPYNKQYYPGFFEALGFTIRKRWSSVETAGTAPLEKMLKRLQGRDRSIGAEGYEFMGLNAAEPRSLRELHAAVERSYGGFLGATPFSRLEFERIWATYLRFIGSEWVTLAYDPGGSLAGFSIAYMDPSDRLRAMRGSDSVFARLRARVRSKRSATAVYYMVGVTPEESAKRRGLGTAAFCHTVRQLLSAGVERVIFALVGDDSPARRLLGDVIERPQREYALYEMNP